MVEDYHMMVQHTTIVGRWWSVDSKPIEQDWIEKSELSLTELISKFGSWSVVASNAVNENVSDEFTVVFSPV